MSFGDGNLRERVESLEDELARAQGTVEDLACENVALRELAVEMCRELRGLADGGARTGAGGYGARLAALGIEVMES